VLDDDDDDDSRPTNCIGLTKVSSVILIKSLMFNQKIEKLNTSLISLKLALK